MKNYPPNYYMVYYSYHLQNCLIIITVTATATNSYYYQIIIIIVAINLKFLRFDCNFLT